MIDNTGETIMKSFAGKFRILFLFCSLLMGCTLRIDLTSESPTQAAPTITSQPTLPLPLPSETPAGPIVPASWSTYRNDQAGFEISFPGNYSALDDAENLYGWTNGVLLLYNGGQSYDIAIQLWNSRQEYENELSNRLESVVVHQVGNRFLTIMNVTQEPENTEIIATFHLVE